MAEDGSPFTPDARATMPAGWQTRSKGPLDNCAVNCMVCCLIQALARPAECCCGKDDPGEVGELSQCGKRKEREESRTCTSRLQQAAATLERSSPQTPPPIAFIGDSDIEWWEPWHLSAWRNETQQQIPVVNIGVGGGNLQDLLLRAADIDPQLQPCMYVVICGENSMLGEVDTSVGMCLGMLRALLKPGSSEPTSLVRRPRALLRHVVFFSSKRAPGTGFMWKKHLEYNAGAKRIIEELNAEEAAANRSEAALKPRFIYHDLAQDEALYPFEGRGLYRSDGLHLSKKGYMVLNHRLQQILQNQVSLEGLAPMAVGAPMPMAMPVGTAVASLSGP